MLELEKITTPIWADKAAIREICGVGANWLARMVEDGEVRTVKDRVGKNGQRLFKIQDILEALEREACHDYNM